MIRLTLPVPPSINSYYKRTRTGGVRISAKGNAFKQEVAILCINARCEPLEGAVKLTVRVYFERNNRDIDNPLKALQDALEGYCYKNDKQIVELHVYKFVDKNHPRCEIEVTHADETR